MLYKKQRALYYYFLMQEIGEAGSGSWKFVADYFGLDAEETGEYEKALLNPVLAELSTLGDVEMYRNYLSGFMCGEDAFGKSQIEQDIIEAKELALHKIVTLFGETSIKGSRLRSLSHNYEKDHIATVLYALQVMYFKSVSQSESIAEGILLKELKKESNSDAGLILLKLKSGDTDEIMSYLSGTPDMLLRPEVLSGLKAQYGWSDADTSFKKKNTIGF